jgi:hypothetical protein
MVRCCHRKGGNVGGAGTSGVDVGGVGSPQSDEDLLD